MPNKRGGGDKIKMGGKFLKILINGGLKINGAGWEFSEKFNLTKPQGSHDTTGRACCGVRFLAENFAPKVHARKRKVLAEHLLFLL